MNESVWDNLANTSNGAVVVDVFIDEAGELVHTIHRAPSIRELFVPELYMITAGCSAEAIELNNVIDAITLLYDVVTRVHHSVCIADKVVATKNAVADELFNAFKRGSYVQAYRYLVAPPLPPKVVFLIV